MSKTIGRTTDFGRDVIVRPAKVIDDDDPDQLSRVKVRVMPEMKDVSEDLLPWASPLTSGLGASLDHGKHTPPEIDSWVRVEISPTWTSFSYSSDEFADGFAAYEHFEAPSSVDAQTYPQPRFVKFKDGTVVFTNTETGDMGIVHSSGTIVTIDTNGKVYVENTDDIEVTTSGEILVSNGSGEFTLKSSGQLDVNGNLTVDP